METSLTVREADRMLSELAGRRSSPVESREGALFYALPRRTQTRSSMAGKSGSPR